MKEIHERILDKITREDISYGELSRVTGIPKSVLQRYATGATKKIPVDSLKLIADALHTSAAYLMGWEDDLPKGAFPFPPMDTVPLVGAIACGEPILAEQNIECQVAKPNTLRADFALRCKGDSMIGAHIQDGDIVYIRQQPTVENGQIAAVLIGEEATLKRVYLTDDTLVLQPENNAYPPLVYSGSALESVQIIGLYVGFTHVVQ